MAIFRTSKGQSVQHCHIPQFPCEEEEFTSVERQIARDWLSLNFPDVIEVRAPSRRYNCHGYAYTRAHGWFNFPAPFITDDFSEVSFDEARRGDVVLYRKNGKLSHSAIVKTVIDGEIETVRSKWAVYGAVIHEMTDVHPSYGEPVLLLRRNRS